MSTTEITTAAYMRGITMRKILGSRSGTGRTVYIPPRSIDPEHVQDPMELVELSGKGRLVSFSVVPVGSSEMLAAGYDRDHPYCVGIVKLDEGPSVSAQLVGVDVAHPASITIGMQVHAAFIERAGGTTTRTVLAFRPDA